MPAPGTPEKSALAALFAPGPVLGPSLLPGAALEGPAAALEASTNTKKPVNPRHARPRATSKNVTLYVYSHFLQGKTSNFSGGRPGKGPKRRKKALAGPCLYV